MNTKKRHPSLEALNRIIDRRLKYPFKKKELITSNPVIETKSIETQNKIKVEKKKKTNHAPKKHKKKKH